MPPTTTTERTGTAELPRIGIPWRTTQEERTGERQKLDCYFAAMRRAGAEPVEISLRQSATEILEQIAKLDGFVLPGSPADVDPACYGAPKHQKTNELDDRRDSTDSAVLRHAFQNGKPVLAICYGCQILNVYLGGSLVQDIRTERPKSGPHGSTDLPPGAVKGDVEHRATFMDGSLLAQLNRAAEGTINSSHHQAIDRVGEGLRVTATAADGIIEGVEWTGGSSWIVGVQWHPERMPGDALAERLFAEFVAAARAVRAQRESSPEAGKASPAIHGSVVQKA
jgi:putative glutamine amidotransferase